MEQKFDAIVVGAGPAGCACAYKLAKAGLSVLVVERGKFPGSKNMWGGAFFGPTLGELLPNFWSEAPFERYISHRKISLLTKDDCLTIDFSSHKFDQQPYEGFVLLRSKFDQWFSNKVMEAGAIVASGLQADDVLKQDGKIVGIKAGNEQMLADVVIACDGVNSLLAQKAGLRGELKTTEVKQGVKEVYQFPRKELEQRFNLKGDAGLSWEFLGACTGGLPGGGFIYTNKDSLSIGLVVQLNALAEKQVRANDLLDGFKKHPAVADLLEGGKLVEYSGHLIPILGVGMMPGLYTDGFMVAGDAAAFVVGTGLILEGANFAIASGISAAETVIKAKEKKNFSAVSLAYYKELLEKSFILKDLNTFRKAPHFLENQRIYTVYPEFFCDLFEKLYTTDGKPRKHILPLLMESIKGRVSLMQIASDLMKAKDAI
jgi:electron transfer flavoprotein-quinone oxidoreductase